MTTTPAPAMTAEEILQAIVGKITDPGTTNSCKVLIYSDPGAGKTTFLGSIPKFLMHDVEDSAFVLKAPIPSIKKDVKVLPYTSFYQVEKVVGFLQENNPAFDAYETYGIDSMSALHKKGLAEITEREWNGGRGRNSAGLPRNRYVAETEDHTENNEHIRRLVDSLKDLNRNIVITAHQRTVQLKDGTVKTYPDFSEKLSNTLAGMMDIVGYMTVKKQGNETVRVLKVKSEGLVTCKTRFTNMPDELVNPTWDMIMQYREEFLRDNPDEV